VHLLRHALLMSHTAAKPTMSHMDVGRGHQRLRRTAFGLAIAGLLALAPGASAAQLDELVPMGSGLTHPAGLARDNVGNLWVADAMLGVCRVDTVTDRVIEDGVYCAPEAEHEEEDGAPTPPPVRPDEAAQIAYDPVTSKLFVAEGTSGSSGVWRMDVDALAGTITGAQKIVPEADRVFALALGDEAGTPVLDYGLKRTPLIKRIINPATCTAPCGSVGSGSALAEEPLGLAHFAGSLFIAEDTGITRILDAGTLGGVAEPVLNFPGGIPGAVAADTATGRVYAGTSNGNQQDQVDVLNVATGAVETYVAGLAGIGALAIGPAGELLIGDDPDLGPEQTGNGRIFSVPLVSLSRPVAQFEDGPGLYTNQDSVSFSFSGPAGTTFLCRQDPDALTPWTPCGVAPLGSSSFSSLSEGTHVLEVKAVSADPAIGDGPVQVRTFVVDRSAPSVTIDNPASDRDVVGDGITMRFSSSDPAAAFACAIDGAAPAPCSDPRRFEGLAVGEHLFAVTATDAAGNTSAPATWDFSIRAPRPGAPAATAPSGGDSGRPPATFGEASRVFGVPRLSVALRPGRVKLLTNRRTRRGLLRSRRLVASARVPSPARWATIALWRTNKRSVKQGRRPIAFAAVRLTGRGTNRVTLTLTRRQAETLRRGRYLVGLVLTDGADRIGPGRYRRLTILR
jgi:hypothetical protein